MKLVNALCTNCGAALMVDTQKDAAICEFCGSAFIVEKAINNYNYQINNHNHIQADVVNVYGAPSNEFRILAGRLIEYCGASAHAIIPNGVSVIGSHAFAGLDCLKSVTIPQGVEVIEAGAFSDCINLLRISIPDTVRTINVGTFKNCNKLSQVSYSYLDENAKAFRGTPFYDSQWGIEWECQFCNCINPGTTKYCQECGFENICEEE